MRFLTQAKLNNDTVDGGKDLSNQLEDNVKDLSDVVAGERQADGGSQRVDNSADLGVHAGELANNNGDSLRLGDGANLDLVNSAV